MNFIKDERTDKAQPTFSIGWFYLFIDESVRFELRIGVYSLERGQGEDWECINNLLSFPLNTENENIL